MMADGARASLRCQAAPPGATREEALRNIHDAVEAYIRDMQKAGQEIAKDAATQVIEEPVVAVTV
jgi:predicted RNase H-like HicB family nuclease